MTVIPFNKDIRLPHDEGQLHQLNKLFNKLLLLVAAAFVFAWVFTDQNVTSAAPKADKLQSRLH